MRNPLIDPDARLVIAHRGNRADYPENTLEGLVSAVESGADAVEFDVRLTRDGVPVLMHDPTLDRTTNGHGSLADYSHEELRSVRAGTREQRPDSGLNVPSLEAVLDRLRETPLVVEVKEFDAIDATERLLARFSLRARAIIGSSDNHVVTRARQLGLHTCASMGEAVRVIPMALRGRTPSPPPYAVLSVTPRYRGVPIPVIRMTAAARRAGIATHVWTINDPHEASRLWTNGVAGIVTDRLAALLRVRPR